MRFSDLRSNYRKFLERILSSNFALKEVAFLSLSAFGLITPLLFSMVDFLGGRTLSAEFEMIYFFLVLAVLISYLLTRNKLMFHLAFLGTLLLFTFLLITGGEDGGGILWFTIFPPMTFYVLEKRWAFLWSLTGEIVIFLFLLRAFCGEKLSFIPEVTYAPTALLQLIVAYTVIFVLTSLIFSLLELALEKLSKAYEEVNREKRRFLSIFTNSPYANVIYDGKGLLFKNEKAIDLAKKLGFDRFEDFFAEIFKVISENSSRVYELKGRFLKVKAYDIDEELKGIIVEDITDYLSYMKAKMDMQALEIINAFTLEIIHEIKNLVMKVYTPLQVVSIKCEALCPKCEGGDDPALKKMLTLAYTGIEEVVRRFQSLRDEFSSYPRHGKMKEIDLEVLLREVVENFKEGIGDISNLDISLIIKAKPKIVGEPYSLSRAFTRMLDNSLEAIQEKMKVDENFRGKIEIVLLQIILNKETSDEMRIISGDVKEGKYALIKIQDNGIGSDDIINAFKPSISSKSELTDRGGLGLGLFIVFKVIQAHGGFISPYSKRGEGTRIDVYLPVKEETS